MHHTMIEKRQLKMHFGEDLKKMVEEMDLYDMIHDIDRWLEAQSKKSDR